MLYALTPSLFMAQDLSFYEIVKINALDSVIQKDQEYMIRHILRWYSKTFHTPLPQVEDIPFVEVLTAYYEERFENMEEQDLKEERIKNSMSPEEWAKKLQEEETQDLAFIEAIKSKKRVEDIEKPKEAPPMVKAEDDGFDMTFEDIPI